MRSTTTPAAHRCAREPESGSATGVLQDLLVIDGVTDLAVYRALTGRGAGLVGVPPPPRPRPPTDGQLPGLLLLVPGGAE